MNSQIFRFPRVIAIIVLVLLSGCYSSWKTTRYSDLEKAENRKEPIRALTVNSTLYTFNTYSFTDSTISGKGSMKQKGAANDFEGTLKFSDIVFLERFESNNWKALWIVPMAAAIVSGVSLIAERPEFDMTRPSEGSCPFVYSYDGSGYKLEAEVFSTSISRAMEAQTFHVLPSLVPVNHRLKVRISNERPETHLVNSAHLFAVDAGKVTSVVLDSANMAWAVHNAVAPVIARDRFGNDILDSIVTKDGRYWKSDLKDLPANSGFRDTLLVQFDVPKDSTKATVIIDATNSDLVTEAYRMAGTILGDQTLSFYRDLEYDPDLKNLALEGIRKTSLLIEAADSSGWKEVGLLPPQADVVPFNRAVRLTNLDHFKRPLTLRLSSMTDVWHIDALSADFSKEEPLTMQPLTMTSASATNHNGNTQKAISKNDSLYAMILPPGHIDITFDSAPADTMQNPVYIFAAQGYLYEWLPSDKNTTHLVVPDWLTGNDRVATLKYLIRHENLFLPQIYEMWNKDKR